MKQTARASRKSAPHIIPRIVRVSQKQLATIMSNDYPDNLYYKIVVSCVTVENCKEVQAYMTARDFVVKREETFEGDHYGLKQFKSYGDAQRAIRDIRDRFNKNKRSPKIRKISMSLELMKVVAS